MGSAGQNGFHDTALVQGPGLVLGRSGASFGQAHYCEKAFWPHNTALYATDFHGNEPLFVFYRLSLIDFSRHNSGGAQQSLNRNFIYPIPVRIPSPDEQRTITTALSDVDALLGALDRLIVKKRDLKQAAMQQLLTGQIRLPGFSGKWERSHLESLSAFITKGSTPTTYGYSWESDGVIFLRSECVSDDGLDLRQSMFISESAHATMRRSEIRNGDILMTITGNVGRVVLLEGLARSANINQHISRIRTHADRAHPPFVYHFLSQRLIREYYGSITTGQAYPQISLQQVRKTEVLLPSMQEQEAIAAALSNMDAELSALEQRRDKTRLLKQGMMQELLTGRTRLV